MVWIEAPTHCNFPDNNVREMFNRALGNSALYSENTWALRLKKIWDASDTSLFLQQQQRFTNEGYKTYWEAVDKTVRYADTILFKKVLKPLKTGTASKNPKEDKYHWHRPEIEDYERHSHCFSHPSSRPESFR